MKRFTLLFIYLFIGSMAMAQSNITFQIDLADLIADGGTVDATGMHMAGSFQAAAGLNDWTPIDSPLTQMAGTDVWETTIAIPDGTYEYKYVLGNDWAFGSEAISGACGPGNGNREMVVAGDETIAFCYDKCTACGTVIPTVNLTLSVDMSNMATQFGTPNNDIVSVAGSLQGWTPGTTVLDDSDGDGIYTVTIEVDANSTHQYKFLFGDDWGYDEGIPSACNVGNNREIAVGDMDMTLPTVCFASCEAACAPLGDPINVTFRTDLNNEVVNADGPHLTGTVQFPGWRKDVLLMDDADGDGFYSYTLLLYPQEYQYKFVNGNSDENEENFDFVSGGCGVDNGVGGSNRYLDLRFTTADTVISHVYNECTLSFPTNTEDLFAQDLGLQIAPNPFSGKTTLTFNNDDNNAFDLTITDASGRIINTIANISDNQVEINAAGLSNGVYFASISNKEGLSTTKRIVVLK